MDLVSAVLQPIVTWGVDHTVRPFIRHISYPFRCTSYIENRNKKVDKLKAARERVQKCVEDEARYDRRIHGDVEKWIGDADGIIAKVERELMEEEGRAKKRCFVGLCPNVKTRYQISKKAEDEAGRVDELLARSKFDAVGYSYVPDIAGMAFSVKDYEAFSSRESLCKDIMDALAVDGVNVVGVHGMGGIGKTTLVKQVARQPTISKLFDKVVMAVVTQNPDVEKIQEEIAEQLGMKLEREGGKVRAERLRSRLKQGKKILVVLDDLWKELNLDEVGIPDKNELGGCKILVTSRDFDVLSIAMDCQKTFPVGVLSEKEAWVLFQKMAGDKFENQELRLVAIKVAQECAGLPLSIVTVARALKNKSLSEWKDALGKLQSPCLTNFVGMQAVAFATIELSYNHLETDELRLTFLLCSLMGYNDELRDLLRYGIGLDMYTDTGTLEGAQNRVRTLVIRLRASCLLLETDSSEQFAMHDVVRDVATSIAYRDYQVVFFESQQVELKWPDKDKLEKCKQMWLHCNVTEVPAKLECPKLDCFCILSPDPRIKIPNNVFEGMRKLNVLDLSRFSSPSLPSSLLLLVNLKTLRLDYSLLGDFAIIGGLKSLEILSLIRSNIKNLSEEIGQLHKLKLLDLSGCYQLEAIPTNVLSALSQLEELYMGSTFDQWKIEANNSQGQNNVCLADLNQLSQLTNLEIRIPNAHVMPKDLLFSEKLQRYRILIGKWRWWDFNSYNALRILKLELNTGIHSEYGVVQKLLKRAEVLYLGKLMGVKNILYELDGEGFPQLKHLHLQNNSEIQYVVNAMERIHSNVFTVLESFFLKELVSLEKICHGKLGDQSFCRLTVVEVERCTKLKHLFSFSVAKGLLQLQRMNVNDCENMEEIFAEEGKVNLNKNEALQRIEFPELRYMSLNVLPRLKNFCSKEKTPYLSKRRSRLWVTDARSQEITEADERRTPVPLFNEKIAFPNLEDLKLHLITVDKLWHDQLPASAFSVQNLKMLSVLGCGNLKYLFYSSMVESLVQLKHLEVCDCELMEEIILVTEETGEERMLLFQKLEFLKLSNLPKLTGFSREPQAANLEENNHNVTRALFDKKVAFQSLTNLEVYGLDNLEMIWHSQQATNSFCELKKLAVSGCQKLGNVFPSELLGRFLRLKELEVSNCCLLEEIFDIQGARIEEIPEPIPFELAGLRLNNLPKLKHIWNKDPEGTLRFRKLHAITACACQVLENVFPFSIARVLSQLESLEIQSCGIKEIVAKDDNAKEINHCFVFHQLTSLVLREIPKCRSFYPGRHSWGCPILKSFEVEDSSIINIITSEYLNFNEEGHLNIPNQQILSQFQKVIPNLEKLFLYGSDTNTARIIWDCQFPDGFVSSLKSLELSHFNDKSGSLPLGFIRRLRNLEKLVVSYSFFKKLFWYEGLLDEEQFSGTLGRLRKLQLNIVKGLRHIWKQDHGFVPDPQNLEILRVINCFSLLNLAPPSASFRNLKTLEVEGCPGLLYLITSSIAKSLEQLANLKVSFCPGMTEIVKHERDETGEEIIFKKLESLEISCLPKLTGFCLGRYALNFPFLSTVTVIRCPNMKIFSSGVSSTPMLLKVQWGYRHSPVHWDGNLNTAIQHFYTTMVGFNGIWDLKISEFPQLKEIWHGKLSVNFSELSTLVVDNCEFFYNAVPAQLLPTLKYLTYFEVRNCNSLEEVFDLEGLSVDQENAGLLPELIDLKLMDLPRLRHIWHKDQQRIFDVKKLRLLEIHNCSSLTSIFTSSMALSLVQLRKMSIINCSVMKVIVAKEGREDAATEKIVFPQLKVIVLKSLPKFTCFYSGSKILEFPSLKDITIDNSPNINTFFSSFLREEGASDLSSAPVFHDEVALPKLKKLKVEWNGTMAEIRHGQLQSKFYSKLQDLELTHFPMDYGIFPSELLLRLPNLRSLVVSDAYFEEIVLHEKTYGEEKCAGVVTQLSKLELCKLPKLMHLLKEDSPYSLLQNLRALTVLECERLKIVVPFPVSFQCLIILKVSKCNQLLNLMAFSTAKSLVQLKRMSITECERIEQIIANEETDIGTVIMFRKLKCLKLHCLGSLTSFCLGNCTFRFPSLEEVIVSQCPNMKIFSEGNTSSPKLRGVLIEEEEDDDDDDEEEEEEEDDEEAEEEDEGCWDGKLNTAIQKLFLKIGQAVVQSNPPSSPKQLGLDYEDTHGKENRILPEAHIDFSMNTKEQAIQNASKEPEITQMALTNSDCHATSHDKEDCTKSQNYPTSMDISCQTSVQIENDPQATNKPLTSSQVPPASSIPESSILPVSSSTTVEQIPESTSHSTTKATLSSSQDLTSNTEDIVEIQTTNAVQLENFAPIHNESDPSTNQTQSSSSRSHFLFSKDMKGKAPMMNTISEEVQEVTNAIKEIAQAILNLNRRIWTEEEIFEAMIALGLEGSMLLDAVDWLVAHPNLIGTFLACPLDLRMEWLVRKMSS